MKESWRECSVVKNTDYSYRGSQLNSQHPHSDSQPSLNSVSGELMPPPDFHGHRQNTHKQRITEGLHSEFQESQSYIEIVSKINNNYYQR